ncbi:MAG: glycosyltransferase [Spirochaetia bacterium]|nr:glycosyltransferase [Spirochaetia bacterium]
MKSAIADAIIPSYRRPRLTLEAVESVKNQSIADIKIFVIEDGCGQIDPKVFQSDSRIKHIVTPDNKGPSAARNLGASLGKSPYLAFLDSDDLWEKEKLERQIEFLEQNKEYNWVHTNEKWIKNGVEIKQKNIYLKQGGFFIERLFSRCLISPSSAMFRRSFWEKEGQFCETFRVAEDFELWLRLNFLYSIGFIEKPLTIKRSGTWEQLSSSLEIDRQRVLALHRFFRLYKRHPLFAKISKSWQKEILYKTRILIKGAAKYKRSERLREYQKWEAVFNNSLTRDIFDAAEGVLKNS